MHTLSGKLALGLALSILFGLLATMSHQTAAATAPGAPASPASEYTAWEEWSAPVGSSTFDITQCSPGAADGNHIQSGDMNGDGRPDLLCLLKHPDGRTNPYVQLAGQGSYAPWEAWYGAIDPGCDFDLVLVGDFDGDGLDDWLCTRVPWYGGWYETIYFSSSGSEFTGPYELALDRMEQFNPAHCRASFVADVNQDGREDAVCHYLYADNSSATRVAMDVPGSHNWSTRSPVAAPGSFRLDVCVALHSGDVNGDGRPDQICSYQYPSASATWVQLAEGHGYGRWERWSENTPQSELDLSHCHFLHAVDVDGDGLIDRLCMYQDGPQTGVLVQTDGPGTPGLQYGNWESWFELSTDVLGCQPFTGDVPSVIDVNGDGMSDILCAYATSADFMTTWIQRSSGSDYGSWEAWTASLSFPMGHCHALIAGDVDNNQHTDLICPTVNDDGSTTTFVQRVKVYKTGLPAAIYN